MTRVTDDYWPCHEETSSYALQTLARIPYVEEHLWRNGRVYWSLDSLMVEPGDVSAAHLRVKQIVSRAISTHEVVPWEGR